MQASHGLLRDASDRPHILHLSGDFPDPFDASKTRVIKTLVDLTSTDFDHRVLSINRKSPTMARLISQATSKGHFDVEACPFEYGTALQYEAPARGLLHRTRLVALGNWITDEVLGSGQKPDLLVAHKLTIEGIAVQHAAKRLGCPYAVCIQGDTDTKIMDARRDLRGEFRRVLDRAQVVFPFTPWALESTQRRLGDLSTKSFLLPCPTELDEAITPSCGNGDLVSVFHLDSYKRKNLKALVSAMRILGRDKEVYRLKILGGGSDTSCAACGSLVKPVPTITLEGAKQRAQVRDVMHSASAFVLPSLRETFGLVFTEALFAGVPIIYPKGTAVDGYFDDEIFAIGVDGRQPSAIADAIRLAVWREAELKSALAEWQQSDRALRFTRVAIADQFTRGLRYACGSSVSDGVSTL